MKEHTKGIITGAITTTLILGIATTALAATGTVSFNRSPIQFNGQQISAAGEDYALNNGCMAPSSITYTDEKGGGTTYLPARRIAELMGVGIGYDAETGAVTVSGEAAPAPTTTPAPDTTASVADYSDWSAEEEAAYQEFKGLWEVETTEVQPLNVSNLILNYKEKNLDKLQAFISDKSVESIQMYCQRNGAELYQKNRISTFLYNIPNMRWIWSDGYKDGDWLLGYSQYWHDVIMQM